MPWSISFTTVALYEGRAIPMLDERILYESFELDPTYDALDVGAAWTMSSVATAGRFAIASIDNRRQIYRRDRLTHSRSIQ